MVDENTKTAVMQQATLAVNPMSSGSGSNIKLADFIGNGLFTITTPFGARGYPEAVVAEHCTVVELAEFAQAVQQACAQSVNTEALRAQRKQVFIDQLSMTAHAKRVVSFLDDLPKPRKRVLFVTYRYTDPSLGGAEQMMEHLLRAADASGDYLVDVIAPEVTRLENHHLYREQYIYEAETAAFIELERTRFARFAVDGNEDAFWDADLRRVWRARADYERLLYLALPSAQQQQTGLAWGWAYPEQSLSGKTYRWGLVDCAVSVPEGATLHLQGEVMAELVLTVTNALGQLCGEYPLKGKFTLDFEDLPVGAVRLFSSIPASEGEDPRPLALKLQHCQVNGQDIDLEAATLCHVHGLPAEQGFELLDQAAAARRHVSLTDVRGPWSSGLETYLIQHTKQYDAVVTHNSVFRPAVAAIQEAKRAGVPSIMIPHAHLDDDYYHFPDVLQAATDASLVLGAPKAACDFFARKGCEVSYLPAGIDAAEPFSQEDVAAFDAVYDQADAATPFVLVLGRKSGAKGYQHVIDEVEQLQGKVRVVLIGPDDDGVTIHSDYATYLGRQPRAVVRGALQRCLALVTMSQSESFGIVLLESWMAKKPVIANKHCAAFHDMATHNENALLVDEKGVAQAIAQLLEDPALAARLGEQGHQITAQYDWSAVGQQFLSALKRLISA